MQKKKILIIDDEVDFTQLMKLNLEGTGKYEVKIENRGSAGLEAAREYKPNIILLDIIMPDMEGSDVAAQMKEDKATAEIPIIFLTAIITEEEVGTDCSVVSGHPFIAKPVTLSRLVTCIDKYAK